VYVSTSSGKQPRRREPVPAEAADPAPRPSRRVFSAEYKLAIVTEYEQAPNGEKGAILRREGLYSSHVIEWARARDAGALSGGGEGGPAPRRVKKTAEQLELEQLRRQNEKLQSDLARTRIALDIMGKAHALLEGISESADDERPPTRS
jgi:transposase